MAMARKYSLEELVEKTRIDPRRIRSWIQKRILDPPEGKGRGAYYVEEHLDRLLFINKLYEAATSERLPLEVLRKTLDDLYESDDPGVVHRVAVGEEKLQVAGLRTAGPQELPGNEPAQEGSPTAPRPRFGIGSDPEHLATVAESSVPAKWPGIKPAKRRARRSSEPWTTIEIRDGLELRLRGVEPDSVAGLARLAQKLREWIDEET